MRAMWYLWLVVALLGAATPLSAARADDTGGSAPPAPPASVPAPAPTESDSLDTSKARRPKVLVANARDPKFDTSPAREPKLLERDRINPRASQGTLDRGASELAWRNWLQSPESKDPAAPPRRITPKSVFITPHNCPEGKRLSGEGCITVQQLGKEAHEKYILEQLNHMNDAGAVVYDYDDSPSGPAIDAAEGPLQLNLPLGGPLTAAASQNVPSLLPINDKREEIKNHEAAAQLEAELEKLKEEVNRISHTNVNVLHKPYTHAVLGDYSKLTADKPKRDNEKANDTALENDQDQGQKEIVFGNVSEDTYQSVNQTRDEVKNIQTDIATNSPDNQTIESSISNNTKSDVPFEKTHTQTSTTSKPTDAATQKFISTTKTTVPNNLKDNEKPTKLHPEIDYSDIGEAVKLISRYAEVITDDTFKNEQKKISEEEGPLGTRTKQQHRKKPLPGDAEVIQGDALPGLYAPPPSPPPSIYADRLPAHLVYPKTPSLGINQRIDYLHYPAQQPHYPQPPADYPFRHVQEYWARPEQFLGPYAHGNPRRHHHSYLQPPHRARRPDAAALAYSPTRDFYRLLGLRHWFSGDDAAER